MSKPIAVIRTDHSLHEGSGKVKRYVSKASESGIKTLILADRVTLSECISFYRECKSHNINPVAGALFSVVDDEMMFNVQQSRNAAVIENVKFVVSLVTGENDASFAKNFSSIENTLILPLLTSSQKKEKVFFGRFKDALFILEELLSSVVGGDRYHALLEFNKSIGTKKSRESMNKGPLGVDLSLMETVYDEEFSVFNELANISLSEEYSRYLSVVLSESKVPLGIKEYFELDGFDFYSKINSHVSVLKSDLYNYLQSIQSKKTPKPEALIKKIVVSCDEASLWLSNSMSAYRNLLRFTGDSCFANKSECEFEELAFLSVVFLITSTSLGCANYKVRSESSYSNLTLFAKNPSGFLNLKKLISHAYISGQSDDLIDKSGGKREVYSYPKVSSDLIRSHSDGLVAIIGLQGDEIDKAISYSGDLGNALSFYRTMFNDDSILVGFTKDATSNDPIVLREYESKKNKILSSLVEKHDLIGFALNQAVFVDSSDFKAHNDKSAALLDYQVDDITAPISGLKGQFLKTENEMSDLFKEEVPLITNSDLLTDFYSLDVALEIELDKPVLPDFPVPGDHTIESYMHFVAKDGLLKKFKLSKCKECGVKDYELIPTPQKAACDDEWGSYVARLDLESKIISEMGFCGYFMIVWEFIKWSKSNGVPVGPGRGSGAGSIVAYGLDITNVDPMEYGLLFERFLNPERVSMPDFDIDFGAGFHPETNKFNDRDSVIAHVQDRYDSKDSEFPSVGQIAAHGLLKPKSAVKKVINIKGMSIKFGDTLSKLFGDDPYIKMKDVYDMDLVSYRYNREPMIREVLECAESLSGFKQSNGVHAGGVVISPTEIVDFSPVSMDIRNPSKLISLFDKDDVEAAGLVKFDFLGLNNLTLMEFAKKYIRDYRGVIVDIENDVNYKDPKVFDFLKTGNAHGVFQVESDGMRKLLIAIGCENMEELSALIALYRPGPIQSGMVDNFIDRKHGREEVSYPDENYQHDSLIPILKPTYGIILYQEQVMKIAQVLAGYSLGGADILRRAMGKKKPEEMEKQRAIFERGAMDNGVDGELAMKIFDLVEKFSGYGFNKSHSMAYAHIAFQTAWFKCYYKVEYMCALLTCYSDDHDKLKPVIDDCAKNGITILPPDINESEIEFKIVSDDVIRFGLGAIKSVGKDVLTDILSEREKGLFTSIIDLRVRCGSSFDARVSSGLIKTGALDKLDLIAELEDGKLRTYAEANALDSMTPELKFLRKDMYDREGELNDILSDGAGLKKMVVSLVSYYKKKYEICGDHSESYLNSLSSSHLTGVAYMLVGKLETLINESVGNVDLIRNDLNSLVSELKKRKSLQCSYIRKKAEVDDIKRKIQELSNSDDLTLSWAAFDKRAFLQVDSTAVLNSSKPVLDIINKFGFDKTKSACDSFSSVPPKEGDVFFGHKQPLVTKVEKTINEVSYSDVVRFSDHYRLEQELEYSTYYVSGHPFECDGLKERALRVFKYTPITSISAPTLIGKEESRERDNEILAQTPSTRVAGVIKQIRLVKVKSPGKNFGRDMAILSIDDSTSVMSVVLFADVYDVAKDYIELGGGFFAEGKVTVDSFKEDGSLSLAPEIVFDPSDMKTEVYKKIQYFNKRN